MPELKVLRIISELDFGGVEQVALNSLPALNELVTLRILVMNKGGKLSKKLEEKGVFIMILNIGVRIPNFRLIRSIREEIESFQPDVVHCQGAEANFHGILASKFAGVPRIIGEEIGIPNHHSYWKWIFRYVYKQAHQVIAISEAVKRWIVGLKEVEPEKVHVIYNPVNIVQGSGFKVQGSTLAPFVFVTTCRLVPIKNLGRLIEAFDELVRENPDKSLKLRIVGDGPEQDNLERKSREQGIGNRIEFVGYQEDVWSFLMAADAFVLPSLREGSSVSLVEAMAVGLPSIVTQVGGASEILSDSHSGFLIDPLDSNSIQSAMQQMLNLSHEERQTMGERAKKEAQRFSVDNYIKELMNIYQSPISNL